MDTRKIMLIVGALVIAIGAAFGVNQMMRGAAAPPARARRGAGHYRADDPGRNRGSCRWEQLSAPTASGSSPGRKNWSKKRIS